MAKQQLKITYEGILKDPDGNVKTIVRYSSHPSGLISNYTGK